MYDVGQLITKVESLQNMMVSHVTGGYSEDADYVRLRRELLAEPGLNGRLPKLVEDCRDTQQLWNLIKERLGTYKERREYIWGLFQPLLHDLEQELVTDGHTDGVALAAGGNRRMVVDPFFTGRGFKPDARRVFVLSPFGEPFDAIYRDHIARVAERSGLRCHRADDVYSNRIIMEDIWQAINEAGIIISDLTGRNPNVFYETGIAHTLGKEVILLTQSRDDVPFDVKHIRYLPYTYTPPGAKKLEADLERTLMNILPRLER